MGFLSRADLITFLKGFRLFRGPGNNDGPTVWRYLSCPTFVEAFPDTIRADRAAQGIADTIRAVEAEPNKNYVDQLFVDPVPDHGVGVLSFGPSGNVFWADKSALIGQKGAGDRLLKLRLNEPGPDLHQLAMLSRPFRVMSGRTYRISVRWAGNSLDAGGPISVQLLTSDSALNFVASYNVTGMLPSVTNTLQYDSSVVTLGATDVFGYLRVSVAVNTPTNGPVYIDEILIEPVGGLVHRSTNAGNSITDATEVIMAFEDAGASSDTDVTYSAGTFTVVRPGDYDIHANLLFTSTQPDTTRYGIKLLAGATSYWGGQWTQSGANFGGAHVSATARLVRGDVIRAYALQVSGAARNLHVDGAFNYITIKRVD